VTDEELSVVDPWIKRAHPGYPIVALQGDAFESALKVDAFPCQAVIDTEGKLTYSDGFGRTGSSGALNAAMAKAKKGPIWPKLFAKAADLITADQLDKSYAELRKVLDAGKELNPEEKAAGDKLKAHLEGAAAEALADAHVIFDAGRVYDAHERLAIFAAAKPPFPATPDCARLLGELEALPDYKAEMKAGEQYVAALELERTKKYSDAFKACKAIVKTFGSTKLANVAKAEAESLIERGLPGFDVNCDACRTGKRACDKHAEKVKL